MVKLVRFLFHHLFRELANQGQKFAQYDLGFLSDKGIGVPQNIEKAIKLWKLAAAQGHGSAKVAKFNDVT
jgi:uncharacterized protein